MSNVAVIGFGYWGKNLIRNFSSLGVLRAVCDSDASRADVVHREYPGTEFSLSADDVLTDPDIDAVAIAAPAVAHYALAKVALEADKDVFVEKPLALEVREAEELVEMAAARGRILMVGHILQYHPAIIRLKELIQNGDLGRIEYLYSNRLNIGKFRTEENILWSFAPHDVSVMLGLLDEEPCEISCNGGDYLSDNVADVTMSQFAFPSGVRAHIFVSWLHPFKEQRLVVVGSDKMAVMDDTADDKLVLYPHRVEWINRVPTAVKAEAEKVPLEVGEPLRAECQHFLACIDSREQPLTDGREGLRVLKVLDACQKALYPSAPQHPAPSSSPDTCHLKPDTHFSHPTACIDEGCEIGAATKIWHFTHVMKGAVIGQRCNIGQNCCISPAVVMGDNVKVQNNVSIYGGAKIEDDVFLGPSCVLTNVSNPRSQINRHSLYEKTVIRRGASIGANATIVCGVEIGRYAFVAAGAVVTKNVPDYGLVMGAPACQVGWMSRHGHRLEEPGADGVMTCPESGYRYKLNEPNVLRCLDIGEDDPLPDDKAVGERPYRDFKTANAKEAASRERRAESSKL